MASRYEAEHERDSQLETKLQSIEQKLDRVLEVLGQQSREGT